MASCVTAMYSPLANKQISAINSASPRPVLSERPTSAARSESSMDEDFTDANSSPFVADLSNPSESENIAPIKLASSPSDHPDEQSPLSPLKPLKSRPTASPMKSSAETRAARRMSGAPIKRFPVKVNVSSREPPTPREETIQLDNGVLKKDEGMARAIQILEDDDSVLDYGNSRHAMDDTIITLGDDDNENFADETAFSTFSAVPDMTMFAKIGRSPSRYSSTDQRARPQSMMATPTASRRHVYDDQDDSPTPRKAHPGGSGNTTNLILDFTEQFSTLSSRNQPPFSRSELLSPAKTSPDLLAFTQNARTPSASKYKQDVTSPTHNRMSYLLDFDIPPAPTPRSMPSVTPRELESLKSGFLSEISSLKATLSGKEAEVQSLKTAVGDAEKRVGDCLEQLQEEQIQKHQLAVEKEGWEKRGNEVELVLRNIKEEMENVERERESLEGRLQESEMRREAAESMAQEAESKMAGMRAASASLSASGSEERKSTSSSREVEIAVEKVARELHTLYKGKHETKVAALKRSYESKWDRKVKDLEDKIEDLSRENEDLRTSSHATMTNVLPSMMDARRLEELKEQAAWDAKNARELEAKLEGMAEEVRTIKTDNEELRGELERERVEKGELVAACDELLTLQEAAPAVSSNSENPPRSVSRASGLRAPAGYSSGASAVSAMASPSAGSRLSKMEKHRSVGSVGGRPGSGHGYSRGIMTNIEKMGNFKGRGE